MAQRYDPVRYGAERYRYVLRSRTLWGRTLQVRTPIPYVMGPNVTGTYSDPVRYGAERYRYVLRSRTLWGRTLQVRTPIQETQRNFALLKLLELVFDQNSLDGLETTRATNQLN